MNIGNAIEIFGAGGLKVTRAVPEKHIINFFWPNYYKIVTELWIKSEFKFLLCHSVNRLSVLYLFHFGMLVF